MKLSEVCTNKIQDTDSESCSEVEASTQKPIAASGLPHAELFLCLTTTIGIGKDGLRMAQPGATWRSWAGTGGAEIGAPSVPKCGWQSPQTPSLSPAGESLFPEKRTGTQGR